MRILYLILIIALSVSCAKKVKKTKKAPPVIMPSVPPVIMPSVVKKPKPPVLPPEPEKKEVVITLGDAEVENPQ